MAAVVDSTARLGRIVHSTEILPFTGAHFGAGGGGARRGVGKEGDDEIVGFHCKEAAKFVEP